MNKTVVSNRIDPFRSDVILMRFVYSSFDARSCALVGGIKQHSLAFSNTAVGFSTISILQGIAAGIGTSNFLRAALIMNLNFSSSGSMKYIPLNCLALPSSGFSTAHLCFAFFFAASDIYVHISGHTSSGRKVVCFLVSHSRTMYIHQVAFRSIR